jgi:hypothetical protein
MIVPSIGLDVIRLTLAIEYDAICNLFIENAQVRSRYVN